MASNPAPTCPLTREAVVERYFLEHRAKLLDIAAFLDRLDRASPAEEAGEDFRVRQLREALDILRDGGGDRARRVLQRMSDPTDGPIDAAPSQGAAGAYAGLVKREGRGH